MNANYINIANVAECLNITNDMRMYINDNGVLKQAPIKQVVSDLPGESSGHYIPSVEQIDDNTMRISFIPSSEDMPTINPVDIRLPSGKHGDSGVYLGSEEPADPNVMVWIDPNGNPHDDA